MSVRTRIAPAPSGDLHVGNVRTALFSWAYARRHEGRFLLRIEDTDASRVSDEAVEATQEILRWVGLDWDEGPGIDGPYAPYRQSERRAIYEQALETLEARGHAYRCYCTAQELAERNAAARAAGRAPGYDGRCRHLGPDARRAFEAEGRSHVLRFPMPAGQTTWTDLVRGDITIAHDQIPDFALTRSDGGPLYVLAAAVDDVAMKLTHIVRGEDLVAATPRQMAIYAALDYPRESWPQFAHLPLLVGADHKPLSKRNGEVSLRHYRDAGFLPEAMLNYLALLGWSLAPDRELFTIAEMVQAFDLAKVSKNPARFDLKKLEAINGEKIRAMTEAELVVTLQPWMRGAGLSDDVGFLQAAVPLVQSRMVRLTEAPELLRFLLVAEEDFLVVDRELLGEAARPVLDAAIAALEPMPVWSAELAEAALRAALVEGLGLKPRNAFGPVRVAVTGRRISPPLFESLELLGRERSLRRLAQARADIDG
ncbi:MAG TPA: glutamate--tRNA ligase [Mycobacteriales bacterium]|nr:glutamate--tRNA ligase [Mycobacteriales bacterium]